MLKAITRAVSQNIANCELTFRQRERVDYERAVRQHERYCELLRRRGASVIAIEACDDNPDCCFVADMAVVLEEVVIIARPGASSRREEVAPIEELLAPRRETVRIRAPATLDGGDVLVLGKQIFVGRSKRTNAEGIEELRRATRPFGYSVTGVSVTGSLHLTTACSALDEETLLINPLWIDAGAFTRQRVLEVPVDEPWAASTMRLGPDCVCVEDGAPRTLELVARHVLDVEVLDISEFRKAEGSLPCLSILFHETGAGRDNKEAMYAD